MASFVMPLLMEGYRFPVDENTTFMDEIDGIQADICLFVQVALQYMLICSHVFFCIP